MTIYAKTSAGRLVAFDSAQGASAPLKGLLRRVDGKTRQAQLLTNAGDDQLLEELIKQQWVYVVSTPWRNSAYVSSLVDRADAEADGPDGPQFSATQPSGLSDESVAAPITTPRSSMEIDSAKTLMGDFVLTYLPQYAVATLREIEALRNKADLLCMLSGYIELVQRAGKPGQQHVQQLLLTVASSD